MQSLKGPEAANIFLKEFTTWIKKRNSYRTWHLD
jgi:hypothetical protein